MIWLDIDPNVVRPGWTPLLITLGLAAVLVVLYLSMRKQMRRINPDLPYEDELPGQRRSEPAAPEDVDPPVGDDQPVDLRQPPGSTS